MIYDAIVVGSGPGGAVAASVLAAQGRSVLMVDRKPFPRDKVCGDGMPWRVLFLLKEIGVDFRKAALDFYQIRGVIIRAPSGHWLATHEDPSQLPSDTFSMASPRLSFDNMIHQHALKQGATFEVMDVDRPLLVKDGAGEKVAGVVERKGKSFIEHEARIVIAADGASSPVARGLRGRVADPSHTAIAIRAYARMLKPLDAQVYFDFYSDVQPGYGWIFPVGPDRVNVGIGLFDQERYRQHKTGLKELLNEFQEKVKGEYPFEIEPETVKTWPLPLWSSNESRVQKGAFLVGDAGCFIDPLTGGGIYPAMITGQFAAMQTHRILDGVSPQIAYADYDIAWRRRIGWALRRADLVQRFVASRSRVFNGIFTFAEAAPSLKGKLLNALAGEHV